MDVQNALLAEVIACPNDDTPWLVLSDYFEEVHELSRAELIRLSVHLRQGDRPGEHHDALQRRLRELYARGFTLPLPRSKLPVGRRAEMEFIFIPPGSFLMGSPLTDHGRGAGKTSVHPVNITRGFWLAAHPVTQGQWNSLLGPATPGRVRGSQLPVEGVSWLDCQEFLEALSNQHNHTLRLPNEAEWEYACRALTTSAYSFGDALSSYQANFDGNYPDGDAEHGPWIEGPTRVGAYPPNGFGLFDMHGNVWEWCADWFAEDYHLQCPKNDPTGPATGLQRVLRGGSWYSYSWSCRSASREHFAPESGESNSGLRVAFT